MKKQPTPKIDVLLSVDKEYIGQTLLKAGFETWFRYMFRVLEGKPFIVEPIHPELFETFQDIYDLKTRRKNINIPPRAGKTTLAKYFVVYCLTQNPKCNFIYTSYSQDLLTVISREIAGILEHPIYKSMYRNSIAEIEVKEEDPVDEFWRQYLYNSKDNKDKVNTYTSRKIVTSQGGVLLFASIGSTITGFGAGIRGGKGFTGCLFIDDANKPADIHSQTMRDKVFGYYVETLLSRLNSSEIPIVNIQQRLHVEDLSGHLIAKYKFPTLVKPLIEPDGTHNIPSQYDNERLEELQFDVATWNAQYQQNPIAEKGNIIQREWWQYFDPEDKITGQLILTADTAYKDTKTADYSCIQVWELRKGEMLLRDMIYGKWQFPELMEKAKIMWSKWTNPKWTNRAKYFFIEDKASGISLEQTLTSQGINAMCWKPRDYDYPDNKVARTKELSFDVYRGLVKIKKDDKMSTYLVNEAALFAADMSHAHDDSVDTCSMAHSIWRYAGGGQ